MTPEAQRIAIAEACGWTKEEPFLNAAGTTSQFWTIGDPHSSEYQQCFQSELPNYLHDLNAMAEAEKTLSDIQYGIYSRNLEEIIAEGCWGKGRDFCGIEFPENMARFYSATAAQRAEAFLRTLGLWKAS